MISKETVALTKSDSAGFIYLYLSLHVCAHKHIQKKHACTPIHTHTHQQTQTPSHITNNKIKRDHQIESV